MADRTETFLVFAAMRNEGAFIVEWVSWYRSLGFNVLIGLNDCTDRSVELVKALAAAGWLDWFEHRPREGQPPKQSAHVAMRRQPAVAAADWLLICDVDEFLVLHDGDGSIGSYLDLVGRGHMGVCFHWQCFGTGGNARYAPGLTHRQFLQRGKGERQVNAFFKTLIRSPLRFGRYTDHGPFIFDGIWGEGENVFVDSDGRVIDRFQTDPHPIRFTTVDAITHRRAQMSHYVLRSAEHYAQKKGTPSASAFKDRYTDQYFAARDKNGIRDLSALARASRFDPVFARAMALPGVGRLHHLCCADYVARLIAPRGGSPQDDPRWQFHMSAAG